MDKRKFNGGNSTKAKGIDKRKNEYKDVFKNAIDESDLVKVIKMLLTKAIKDQDTNSAKLLLEYSLGKPKQTIDQNNTHTLDNFDLKNLYGKDNEA
tara:strand:- start:1067 stop:1354 length:288 start_codon:yes stop_codon:yes gene_type:complete